MAVYKIRSFVAAVLLGTVMLGGTYTQASETGGTIAQESFAVPKPKFRNGCSKLYSQKYHVSYARSVYRRSYVSKQARQKLKRLRQCASSAKAGRNMRAYESRLKPSYRYYRFVAKLPFPGPRGSRWAIPWYIVNCEREKFRGPLQGFSRIWESLNESSDARGPYQLLGWGAPMPANTYARKITHHKIAARLWNGGRGKSHWVCA